jgi:hypothetical protein
MKKTTKGPLENPKPQLTRVTRMLRHIQPWLRSQRGRVATFAEIGSWTGVPENTVRGWFANQGNPTAEFLLRLLERSPESLQSGIMDEFCRVWPSLEHPRLSGDRTIVSRLTTLLSQPRGFTYVQGGNDEMRTFLITALGHSFLALTQPPQRVMGLDVHAPDWFVPVPGVVYLENAFERDELGRAFQLVWSQLRNGATPLVIFNGLWSVLPELQEKIRVLADRCHLMVADESKIEAKQLVGHQPIRTNVIAVSSKEPKLRGIAIEISTL